MTVEQNEWIDVICNHDFHKNIYYMSECRLFYGKFAIKSRRGIRHFACSVGRSELIVSEKIKSELAERVCSEHEGDTQNSFITGSVHALNASRKIFYLAREHFNALDKNTEISWCSYSQNANLIFYPCLLTYPNWFPRG